MPGRSGLLVAGLGFLIYPSGLRFEVMSSAAKGLREFALGIVVVLGTCVSTWMCRLLLQEDHEDLRDTGSPDTDDLAERFDDLRESFDFRASNMLIPLFRFDVAWNSGSGDMLPVVCGTINEWSECLFVTWGNALYEAL